MENINDLIEHIEKEIKLSEDLILNTIWNKDNVDTLYRNIEIMNEYKTTLKHIKQYRRGLI